MRPPRHLALAAEAPSLHGVNEPHCGPGNKDGADDRRGLTRRGLISAAAAGSVGISLGAAGGLALDEQPPNQVDEPRRELFHGLHQGGIDTLPQNHIHFAAFDVTAGSATELRGLLETWSRTAALLAQDRRIGVPERDRPPEDPGEALGLGTNRLTVTFGFGPSLFESSGADRLGLRTARPSALVNLPAFPGEALEARRSGGDLCVQACADNPQVAFHAIHTLARAGSGAVVPRWTQAGFRANRDSSRPARPRNLFGFKDGTNNVAGDDSEALARHVWVGTSDGPAWMRNGSYLVVRRIRMLFDVWDAATLEGQERVFGREKESGAPLGQRRENDRPDLSSDAIPADAHIRVASPRANGGERLLRRSYSFNDGIDADTGQIDAGLLFACYQRDPRRQFVPIQRRLAVDDALGRHTLHTGSAIFACPPGARPGGFVGETLFRDL